MIDVHAKNAHQSEGKARIEEMAALKNAVSSFSNRKISLVAGGMFAFILYLRSLWAPEQVSAQEVDRSKEQENQGPLPAEETSARTTILNGSVSMKPDDDRQADGPEVLAANVGNPGNVLPSASFASSGLQPSEPLQLFRVKPGAAGPNEAFTGIPTHTPPQTQLPVGSRPEAAGGNVAVSTANTADRTDQTDTGAQQSEMDPEGQLGDGASVDDPSASTDEHSMANTAESADQTDAGMQQSESDLEGQSGDGASVADPSTGKDDHSMRCPDDAAGAEDCEGVWVSCEQSICSEEAPDFVEHVLKVAAEEIGTVNVAGSGKYAVGGVDADMFIGSAGADTISAGKGDDVAIGGLGDDQIDGGDGDDLLIGGGADDVLHGGQGRDLLIGGLGSDTLFGGMGDDRMLGQDGDDVLWDGEGQDILVGGLGNDTIYLIADASVDVVDGGAGFDKLVLDDAAGSTRVDLVSGNVETDGRLSDQFDGIECVVAGDGSDVFDFSGLVAPAAQINEPMFFQITNFGRGDKLRMSEDFSLGFDEFVDDSQWSSAKSASSELEMRINQASVDSADAALTRLSFRTLSEEKILTRVLEFDFDGDGRFDLELTVALNETDQTDLVAQA